MSNNGLDANSDKPSERLAGKLLRGPRAAVQWFVYAYSELAETHPRFQYVLMALGTCAAAAIVYSLFLGNWKVALFGFVAAVAASVIVGILFGKDESGKRRQVGRAVLQWMIILGFAVVLAIALIAVYRETIAPSPLTKDEASYHSETVKELEALSQEYFAALNSTRKEKMADVQEKLNRLIKRLEDRTVPSTHPAWKAMRISALFHASSLKTEADFESVYPLLVAQVNRLDREGGSEKPARKDAALWDAVPIEQRKQLSESAQRTIRYCKEFDLLLDQARTSDTWEGKELQDWLKNWDMDVEFMVEYDRTVAVGALFVLGEASHDQFIAQMNSLSRNFPHRSHTNPAEDSNLLTIAKDASTGEKQ